LVLTAISLRQHILHLLIELVEPGIHITDSFINSGVYGGRDRLSRCYIHLSDESALDEEEHTGKEHGTADAHQRINRGAPPTKNALQGEGGTNESGTD
jgi:hypothetical protein